MILMRPSKPKLISRAAIKSFFFLAICRNQKLETIPLRLEWFLALALSLYFCLSFFPSLSLLYPYLPLLCSLCHAIVLSIVLKVPLRTTGGKSDNKTCLPSEFCWACATHSRMLPPSLPLSNKLLFYSHLLASFSLKTSLPLLPSLLPRQTRKFRISYVTFESSFIFCWFLFGASCLWFDFSLWFSQHISDL